MPNETNGQDDKHYVSLTRIIMEGITTYLNEHPDCKNDIAAEALRNVADALLLRR